MSDLLRRLLRRDEGCRLEPYLDRLGFWTIGYGHLIDKRRGGKIPDWISAFPIEQDEAEHLLDTDILEKERRIGEAWPSFHGMPALVQIVVVAMAFQLGTAGALSFVKTLRAMEGGLWGDAAKAMRASRWYGQTKKRAERLAMAVETQDAKFLEL